MKASVYVLIFLVLNISSWPIHAMDGKDAKPMKTRNEWIESAKAFAKEKYGEIDFEDFRNVTVEKKSDDVRVVFRAGVTLASDLGGSRTTRDSFVVYFSSKGTLIDPKEKKHLTTYPADFKKIAKLFSVGDSISVQSFPDSYRAIVSHPAGGTECYLIHKGSFEKKMEWHEHPNPADHGARGVLEPKPGSKSKSGAAAIDDWVEIEE